MVDVSLAFTSSQTMKISDCTVEETLTALIIYNQDGTKSVVPLVNLWYYEIKEEQ